MSDPGNTDDPTNTAVLVLSTGRCGTQWLAATLDELYGDRVTVTHEPIGPEYRCREFFRAYDRLDDMAAVPKIASHLATIETTLRSRSYIETGWPLFSALPLFLERLAAPVRIVHLTRHPVPTAISHMAHKTYGGSPRVDGYTQLAALDAFCPGVRRTEVRAKWDDFTPYEKTLFWWTEVHLYAEELQQRYPQVPFHRVKAEDMLSGDGDTLQDLCAFAGLPFREQLQERTTKRVDQWHHRTDTEFDWRRVADHPATVGLAERLGYDFSTVDERALAVRYKE